MDEKKKNISHISKGFKLLELSWWEVAAIHRASSAEIVMSFTEAGAPAQPEASWPESIILLLINAGLLGEGTFTSFPSMNTTSSMLGRSVACSCTHKSPIWIHLKTSWAGYDASSPNEESTISRDLPSVHRSHAWSSRRVIS